MENFNTLMLAYNSLHAVTLGKGLYDGCMTDDKSNCSKVINFFSCVIFLFLRLYLGQSVNLVY